MLPSYRDAISTLRYTDLDLLRQRAEELVVDIQRQCRTEASRCPEGHYDAREEAEGWLRERGGPWFALSSFVLPGWTWAGFPIAIDKKPLLHVNWLMMRLDDFARELERYRQLFESTDFSILAPKEGLRRILNPELAALNERGLATWELYDSIQTLCTLTLEALSVPAHQLVDKTVKGFIAARPPSGEELERFVEDLCHAVETAVFDAWGLPPHPSIEVKLAEDDVALNQLDWFIDWADDRLRRRAFLDVKEKNKLTYDITDARERRVHKEREIRSTLAEAMANLEQEIEQIESDWISADDRDSIVTGDRLDRELVLKQHKLNALQDYLESLEKRSSNVLE